jgi:hypothetical protein
MTDAGTISTELSYAWQSFVNDFLECFTRNQQMAYTTYWDMDGRGLHVRLSFYISCITPGNESYNETICGSFISLVYYLPTPQETLFF